MAKICQVKKIYFSFFVPHFSAKNEKLKKSEKQTIFVSGKDAEVTAMALTKIGIIFYQHLGFTIRAKDYFKEAMDLATVLTGNKYTNQWYLELTSTMRKIQDAAQKAEDEKWENKRKPFMEQLEKDGTIAKLWVGKAYSIKGLFLKINSYCFSRKFKMSRQKNS